MAIQGYDKTSFVESLSKVVFPSQPVTSVEHLHGRGAELDRIEKALSLPGRHVFIYGDRGVGKSSLAATAAGQVQSADAEYIDVACSPSSTLASIVAGIACQSLKDCQVKERVTKTKAALSLKFLTLERENSVTISGLAGRITSPADALEVLKEVSAVHSKNCVVVMDEFDRIKSNDERSAFADLVKELGDKRVNIKFIITGVGTSLDALLGAHPSAYRQFDTIELPRLGWDARWDIVLAGCGRFGIEISRDIYTRIAAVSDGFPYYAQLLTEKLLWGVYEKEIVVKEIAWHHYQGALCEAIDSISAELKKPYELILGQRSSDYEEVLWSTADSEYLRRYVKDMYSSYLHIMKFFPERTPLDSNKYSARIRSLRQPACGSILVPDTRQGYYGYRENMFRGYVRLQAEAQGVALVGTTEATANQKQYMRAARTKGYFASRIPKGIHFGRGRKT